MKKIKDEKKRKIVETVVLYAIFPPAIIFPVTEAVKEMVIAVGDKIEAIGNN